MFRRQNKSQMIYRLALLFEAHQATHYLMRILSFGYFPRILKTLEELYVLWMVIQDTSMYMFTPITLLGVNTYVLILRLRYPIIFR